MANESSVQTATSKPAASWHPTTLEIVKATKAAGLNADQATSILIAFANIDVAIKINDQVGILLREQKAGTLDPKDFLDAIINIVRTDKNLVGTKVEALHKAFGVPMAQKPPRLPKAKPAVAAAPTAK